MSESIVAKADASKRYRFSVPDNDVSVVEWIEAQSNVSFSLRVLIKEFVRNHGICDATCAPVEQRGPVGRPRKEVVEARLAAQAASEMQREVPQIPQDALEQQSEEFVRPMSQRAPATQQPARMGIQTPHVAHYSPQQQEDLTVPTYQRQYQQQYKQQPLRQSRPVQAPAVSQDASDLLGSI